MEIPVRMNLVLPILMGAVAVLNIGVFLLTGSGMQLLLGVMFLALGALNASRSLFVWTGEAFELRNGFGMVMKTHEVADPSLVRFDGNDIYYGDEKLFGAMTTFMARGSDWQKLKEALGAK